MKNSTKTNQEVINQMLNAQQFEVENNFPNGNLWNDLEDMIYFLQKFEQVNKPIEIKNKFGSVIGFELNNGTQYIFEGVTFENQY